MKKVFLSLAAIALVGLYAGSAVAAGCNFDAPGKAKGFKTDMVRAFASCPGITQSINVATGAGVPGCAPPFALSPYTFEKVLNKGKCAVKTTQKAEVPCKDGVSPSCANIKLSAKCQGVAESDQTTPVSNNGWALQTVARTTFNDDQGTEGDPLDDIDMTVIDFPITFTVAAGGVKAGKFKVKADTNTVLEGLFGPGSALPLCTEVQIISLAIADPDGNIFAVMGSSTR